MTIEKMLQGLHAMALETGTGSATIVLKPGKQK